MAESMSDDELMAALGQSSAASLSDEELLSRLNVPRGTAETPTNMTPAVAEGVSAVNRGIVAIPDFVIDAVNAPIQAAGFDPIPNATELIRRIEPRFAQEGFMEPGLARDVIQAAGETAPIALGVGTAVRQAASALPNIVRGGESVGRGALRQSVTTPAEDIATGALAGAGAEVGEEVGGRIGGETGAQVGRLAGAVAAPASLAAISPATATAREINNALRQSSPALNTLRQQSDDLYRQIDGLGVAFKQPAVAQLADDIERELVKSGLDENLTPKTFQLLSRIRSDAERPLTATEVDTLRKLASVPASDVDDIGKATLDSRLGTKVIEKLDDFLSSPQQNILTGRGEVGPLFSQARKLVAQRKKGERLAEAFNKASLQASGFENGLRVQFRSILNSPSKRRGFNQEELAMMRKVVEGGKLENAARILGKFGLSLDLSGGRVFGRRNGIGRIDCWRRTRWVGFRRIRGLSLWGKTSRKGNDQKQR